MFFSPTQSGACCTNAMAVAPRCAALFRSQQQLQIQHQLQQMQRQYVARGSVVQLDPLQSLNCCVMWASVTCCFSPPLFCTRATTKCSAAPLYPLPPDNPLRSDTTSPSVCASMAPPQHQHSQRPRCSCRTCFSLPPNCVRLTTTPVCVWFDTLPPSCCMQPPLPCSCHRSDPACGRPRLLAHRRRASCGSVLCWVPLTQW